MSDKIIVEQALMIWISLILYDSDVLINIYAKQQDCEKNGTTSIVETLISDGLVCNNFSIRECFKDKLKFIWKSVRS